MGTGKLSKNDFPHRDGFKLHESVTNNFKIVCQILRNLFNFLSPGVMNFEHPSSCFGTRKGNNIYPFLKSRQNFIRVSDFDINIREILYFGHSFSTKNSHLYPP